MSGEESRLELQFACCRLVKLYRALEALQGMEDPAVPVLRKSMDVAKAEVERLLPADAADALTEARRLVEAQDAGHGPDPETSAFRDTAIVIGIATAAAIGVAPVAAWVVHEAVVKELVKAAVSGVFVGVATLAAERLIHKRRRRAKAAESLTNVPTAPVIVAPTTQVDSAADIQDPFPPRVSGQLRLGQQPTATGAAVNADEAHQIAESDDTSTVILPSHSNETSQDRDRDHGALDL